MAFRVLTYVGFTCALCAPCLAQKSAAWPTAAALGEHQLEVVTISEPLRKQPCIPAAIDAMTLTCIHPFDGTRVLYPAAQVQALYELYKPFPVVKTVLVSAVVGLGIALAVVNPVGFAVSGLLALPLIVPFTGVAMPPSPFPLPPRPPKQPHFKRRLLYQRAAVSN